MADAKTDSAVDPTQSFLLKHVLMSIPQSPVQNCHFYHGARSQKSMALDCKSTKPLIVDLSTLRIPNG